MIETRYWIQDQAEGGNFYDSIGFSPDKSLDDAKKELKSHRKAWPHRESRLILRVDVVVPVK